MGVVKSLFGYLPDGRAITEYTLEAKGGMRCAVLDLGGIITQLLAPTACPRRILWSIPPHSKPNYASWRATPASTPKR